METRTPADTARDTPMFDDLYQAAEVKKGMALLDEKYPNWRNKLNLDTLNMRHPWQCVLGQVYGSYLTGLRMLELGANQETFYGFDIAGAFLSFDASFQASERLGETWKQLVLMSGEKEA